MDFTIEVNIAFKLFLAIILGGVIGLDRERHGRDAGIRTYAAVCIGATLFTSIGYHLSNDPAAVSRIIANIVTGVGFLGAGIIYRNNIEGGSHGLTTAATVWCTAGVGVAIAMNMFIIAIVGASLLYFLLSLHHQGWYKTLKGKIRSDHHHDKTDS